MAKKKVTPLDLLRKQFEEFKRSGTVQTRQYAFARCYVCGRSSPQKDMRYIGKDKDGGELYRHEGCEAGSASWFKHFKSKSGVGKYFDIPDNGDRSDDGKS